MIPVTFAALRRANVARDREWNTGAAPLPLAFRAVELAGETGEACNLIKKLERARLGLKGSQTSLGDLADELADVVICVDLIAMALDLDLSAAIIRKFDWTSQKHGFATRLAPPAEAEAARLAAVATAIHRLALSERGWSQATIDEALAHAPRSPVGLRLAKIALDALDALDGEG